MYKEESWNTFGYIIVFMAQSFLIRCAKPTIYITHYNIGVLAHHGVLRVTRAINTSFFTL